VGRAMRSIVQSIHLIKTNPELTKRAIKKYMRFKDDRDTEEAYQIMGDIHCAEKALSHCRRYEGRSR